MSNYVVAIPSYQRQEVLIKKSLQTLKKGGVDPKKIHIFVANKEEYETYEKEVPKELYGKLITGKLGITEQRKYITKYFPEGTHIVSIDDDVEGLFRSKGTTKLVEIKKVDTFFKDAFDTLKKENLYIWGIYPVSNPFFMKDKVTTELKFIIGTLFGYINRHDKTLQPSSSIKEKEDYEMSILYFLKDGGVLRYNNVTIKTKFHAAGGLGKTEGRFEANKDAAEYLSKKYPELVSVFKRKNGMSEVKLRRGTKKECVKKNKTQKKKAKQ
uniref:Glycosyltransferase n=1 Tax=viral metagenome TaxID=1070528 RepID=A0A6C0I3H6_9ZZZZ